MMHPTDRAVEQPWWRNKRLRMHLMVVPAIILGSAIIFALPGTGERVLRVPQNQLTIAVAEQGVFRDIVPLRGTIQPKEILYLDAVEGGQVQEVLVQPGDHVMAGQPLIRFRNAQLELDILNNAGRLIESITQLQTFETQLENNRASNQKALTEIHANIAQLESRLARIDPLTARGFYPRGEAELLHKQLASYRQLEAVQQATNQQQETLRRKQLPRIREQQESLQANLAATQKQLENLLVRAPITGTITQLDLKIGQIRNRGDRLAQITGTAGYEISAQVDEFYLPRIRTGQTASVRIDGENYDLRVSLILPQVSSGVFTVELDFIGQAPSSLTPGAAAEGELALGSSRRALVLPAGPFLESWRAAGLFVLNEAGSSALRQPVKVGRRSDRQVEILGGLTAGARVITSDYSTYDRIDRINIER